MPTPNDGEKLLAVMSQSKASEMRLGPGGRLQFCVSGEWFEKGNRELTALDIRGVTVALLGEELANVASSGKDVQSRYELPGHGRFIVRANGREAAGLISVIPEGEPGFAGPDFQA